MVDVFTACPGCGSDTYLEGTAFTDALGRVWHGECRPRKLPPCTGFVNDPDEEWDGNQFCVCGRMRQAHERAR